MAVVGGDTLFALVSGLAIFPTVFAFRGDPAAGPELAFITLPQVFLEMPGGAIVGTAFFLLLVVEGFGCRPMTTTRLAPWPASESL